MRVRPLPGRSWRGRALLAAAVIGGARLAGAQSLTPAPTPMVRSPGNAQWAASPDAAKQRAKAESKYVFYEFDRPHCGNCTRMDSLLYPAFDFEALLVPMVPVKVSLDSPEGQQLAHRYNVDNVPAILVTTPEGRMIFEMVGFLNTEDFYPRIHKDLEDYRRLARELQGQDVSTLPAREALETGSVLEQRSDPVAALPRLKQAISAKDSTPSIRDEAREMLAAAELDLGQVDASRATVDQLIQTTQDSLHRQRAELFRAQLPLAENKPGEAVALFEKFLKDHPDSPYRKQVTDLLEKFSQAPSKK